MQITLQKLAELIDGEVIGNNSTIITGIADIQDAVAVSYTHLDVYKRQILSS